jgi:hypothetical protein
VFFIGYRGIPGERLADTRELIITGSNFECTTIRMLFLKEYPDI